MKKGFKKVLLIYKKSAYSIYFMERKIKLADGGKANLKNEMRRFIKAHEEHYSALKEVERILRKYGIKYDKHSRGGKVNFVHYDLIITVGGDGTFLEAARKIKDQAIIGVNSAPSYSVGQLCGGHVNNFDRIIRRLTQWKCQLTLWQRLRLDLEGHIRPVDCVNDILVCHSNPAAMSRYYLQIGKVKEEQRSSGLWIAAPAGSSGAIRSAGGKQLDILAKLIQYRPRELYCGFKRHYRHTGGILKTYQKLSVTSLMRNGMIFVDGTHMKYHFPFNAKLTVSLSPYPLKVIQLN
jgi:NAD+ kinase